jgi:hypothetical protein
MLLVLGFCWVHLSLLCTQSKAFVPIISREQSLAYSIGTGVSSEHSYLSKRSASLSVKPREKIREASNSNELLPSIDLEKDSSPSPRLFYKAADTSSISKQESELEPISASFPDYE